MVNLAGMPGARAAGKEISKEAEGRIVTHGRKLAVIGLGYVGLPVGVAFARQGAPVVGFDIDAARIEELTAGYDRTREVDKEGSRSPEPAPHVQSTRPLGGGFLHRDRANPARRSPAPGFLQRCSGHRKSSEKS